MKKSHLENMQKAAVQISRVTAGPVPDFASSSEIKSRAEKAKRAASNISSGERRPHLVFQIISETKRSRPR